MVDRRRMALGVGLGVGYLEKEFAAFRSRYSDTVPRVEFRR